MPPAAAAFDHCGGCCCRWCRCDPKHGSETLLMQSLPAAKLTTTAAAADPFYCYCCCCCCRCDSKHGSGTPIDAIGACCKAFAVMSHVDCYGTTGGLLMLLLLLLTPAAAAAAAGVGPNTAEAPPLTL